MTNIIWSYAHGDDTPTTFGLIGVRRVARGTSGEMLVISAFRDIALSSEGASSEIEAGTVIEVVEIDPPGVRAYYEVPDEEEVFIKDLTPVIPVPGGDGAFVVETQYTDYNGATGEPDVEVGEYWYASNPAHPDYGYLMQKGS